MDDEFIENLQPLNQHTGKDLEIYLRFLDAVISKNSAQTNNLDTQSNIVLGIATAIFVFSTSQLDSRQSIVFYILSIFSAASALIGLMAVHPPKFLRIKNKHETVKSLMGNKRISSYHSSQEYADRLLTLLGDVRKITAHYAAQIYNSNVNYYRPKRNMIKLSVKVLSAGIAMALATVLYQIISNLFR